MSEHTQTISSIFEALGYGDWHPTALKGDASARRFWRLTAADGKCVIAMRTPPDQAPSEKAFVGMARLLKTNGLAAPDILAQNQDLGVIVMEDLGQTDVATAVRIAPKDETRIYDRCIETLCAVQAITPPDTLGQLTSQTGTGMLDPFFRFFAPETPSSTVLAITDAMTETLDATRTVTPVLSLRDFHAENLIWRPDRTGRDQIGLIDFQDAFIAPPEYDLVSLLRDARRDVSAATYSQALVRFAELTGSDVSDISTRCAILGVQRNLRILGIFQRLGQRDQKPGYLGLIPRVAAHIMNDLMHPANATLSPLVSPLITDHLQ